MNVQDAEIERVLSDMMTSDTGRIKISTIENLGLALYNADSYLAALCLFEEQALMAREDEEMGFLKDASNNIGYTLEALGDPDKAMAAYKEEEVICRTHSYPRDLAVSLINQAQILTDHKGNIVSGMPLAKEAIKLFHELGETDFVAKVQAFIQQYEPDFLFKTDGYNSKKISHPVINLADYRYKIEIQ